VHVTLTLHGKRQDLEVDLEARTITVEGVRRSFQVLVPGGERGELEIEGEKIVVEGWPAGLPSPLTDLSVNGERVELVVESRSMVPVPQRVPTSTTAPDGRTANVVAPPAPTSEGPGVVLRPPMPGKVIEVKVAEGATVTAGQVLLVLEAMKMRNDVLAPSAGTIRDLRVVPGTNVRAKDPMLRIEPPGGV
jgi:biotin carboxyl carrier protein